MSKFELYQIASEQSGVLHEQSMTALTLQPSLYERVGEEGLLKLSTLFYTRVFADKQSAWFLNIFSSSTKDEAIDNQFRFFVQSFGGPALYEEKKGKYTRLAGRHASYNIGPKAAERWVTHMLQAMQEHPEIAADLEAYAALEKYFRFTAYYLVATMTYMKSDQLSGGTQIDEGRVW